MKKSFKRIFSILLGMLVLCTIVPGAYAQVNVSKLPAGNSEGRLIEEGMSVRIGNYETLDAENTETFADGAVLADGFFFSAAEILTYKDAADITGESDSITLTTPDSNQTETGTRTLDDYQLLLADVNLKNGVTSTDALWISQRIAGIRDDNYIFQGGN